MKSIFFLPDIVSNCILFILRKNLGRLLGKSTAMQHFRFLKTYIFFKKFICVVKKWGVWWFDASYHCSLFYTIFVFISRKMESWIRHQ